MGARVRQRVTAASLPRWARPGEGHWSDWASAGELAALGGLAPVHLFHCLVAALDIWREHGGPDWEAAGIEPAYPGLPPGWPLQPGEIPEAVRRGGAPPGWLRDAARDRAQMGAPRV